MKSFLNNLVRFIFVLGLTFNAFAVDKACEDPFTPEEGAGQTEFKVIPSTRVAEEAKVYQDYVSKLVEPNGVLDQLGIKMTGQIVEFLQARDLNALTSGSAGGYPVRHYLDGASIIQSLNPARSGFALEVVYPGPHYQHGFYRDDNPTDEQISIIDHVVGHNSFALNSGLKHYRYDQGLEATKELDAVLRDAYEHFDKDQVQRFYLWALTVGSLWDWYSPLLETPESFEPSLNIREGRGPNERKREIERNPRRPTENILPAFISNFEPHQPAWKKQILEKIMSGMAFRPALVHTQIMNEGWASIMQEIIPRFTDRNNNFNYWFRASQVMQREDDPNLRDPYSLGVAVWRRIRERLFETPAVRALTSPIEKERAFIEHAVQLIQTMTDEEFLRYGVDQKFVDRFNLSVLRKVNDNEFDWSLPRDRSISGPGQDNNAQWVIVSKEADRVVQMIIDKVLKPKYFYRPRVKLVDFRRPSSGEVELVLDDSVGVSLPLDSESVGPSMYAMAKVMDRPMSLVCTLVEEQVEVNPSDDPMYALYPNYGQYPYDYTPPEPKRYRARVVVGPNGDLKVYRITDSRANEEISMWPAEKRNLNEAFDEKATKELSAHLGEYIDDLYLEDQTELQRVFDNSPGLKALVTATVSNTIDSNAYDGLISQAPNSAGAIVEYKIMAERRLLGALERALKSGKGISTSYRGIRIKALPDVVGFQFDQEYMQWAKQKMSTEDAITTSKNINRTFATNGSIANPFGRDEAGGGSVGPIRGQEGDKYWGPKDAEGRSQDEGDEPGEGIKPGEDPNDVTWIDVPSDLYAKFLTERVKLPILNKKAGSSRRMSTKQGGSIRRRNGSILPQEVIPNAVKRGVGAALQEGNDDPFEDLGETLGLGLERLQPRDIVVKSKVPKKIPDIKAVVVFVMDSSGSTAYYAEAFKRFVHDIQTLIAANYKGFDFKYIVFDSEAHVLDNAEAFFRSKLGGGTKYSVGIDKASQLFEESYPRATWDRYTFLLGDMEDSAPAAAQQKIVDLLENSEFFGTIAGIYSPSQLNTSLQSEASGREDMGYTLINRDGRYEIRNIKEVLNNED